MGTERALETLLISFGAGVGASDCVNACGDGSDARRWMLVLSVIIFVPPIWASPLLRRVLPLVKNRWSSPPILPQLTG